MTKFQHAISDQAWLLGKHFSKILAFATRECTGELAEWSNAAVLKTVDGLNRPGVRIPRSPPLCGKLLKNVHFKVFWA